MRHQSPCTTVESMSYVLGVLWYRHFLDNFLGLRTFRSHHTRLAVLVWRHHRSHFLSGFSAVPFAEYTSASIVTELGRADERLRQIRSALLLVTTMGLGCCRFRCRFWNHLELVPVVTSAMLEEAIRNASSAISVRSTRKIPHAWKPLHVLVCVASRKHVQKSLQTPCD